MQSDKNLDCYTQKKNVSPITQKKIQVIRKHFNKTGKISIRIKNPYAHSYNSIISFFSHCVKKNF